MSIIGEKELMAALAKLGDPKTAKSVVRSGITKGLRVLAKSVKAQIPPKYKAAKRGIGSKFGKPKTRDNVEARVGVGVGITRKQLAKFKRKDRGKRPGLGAQPENLHWFILGTDERQTGSRTRKRGGAVTRKPTGNKVRRTGRMRPHPEVANIIKNGMAAGQAEATKRIIDGCRERLALEAAKVRKR